MKKMYVITRNDLGNIYKMVQGAHALAQYMLDHPNEANEWNNRTIVFVSVEDEYELTEFLMKLLDRNVKLSTFYEPDIGNQLTGIASYSDERYFSKLNLA